MRILTVMDGGARQKVDALRQALGVKAGFFGNVDDYYNPANSCLDSVMASRRGLPLTLVYIFVERRLGWQVDGISVPSHYLGTLDGILFDPFHGGVAVNEDRVLGAVYELRAKIKAAVR